MVEIPPRNTIWPSCEIGDHDDCTGVPQWNECSCPCHVNKRTVFDLHYFGHVARERLGIKTEKENDNE